MPTMRIITWNSQGCIFNDSQKSTILSDLVKNNYVNATDIDPILVIQEAGTYSTMENIKEKFIYNDDYTIYAFAPYQTKKSKCCLSIMVPKNKIKGKFTVHKIDSQQESRPVACLNYGSGALLIANIHTTPSYNTDHATGARDIVSTIQALNKGTTPWLLVGDMNCPPNELTDYDVYDAIKDKAVIIPPTIATHKNSILDYMIVGKYLKNDVQYINVVSGYPSDHNPVVYQLTI